MSMKQQQFADSLSVLRVHSPVSAGEVRCLSNSNSLPTVCQYCVYIDSCQSVQFDAYVTNFNFSAQFAVSVSIACT